jgi:hypothetical protein
MHTLYICDLCVLRAHTRRQWPVGTPPPKHPTPAPASNSIDHRWPQLPSASQYLSFSPAVSGPRGCHVLPAGRGIGQSAKEEVPGKKARRCPSRRRQGGEDDTEPAKEAFWLCAGIFSPSASSPATAISSFPQAALSSLTAHAHPHAAPPQSNISSPTKTLSACPFLLPCPPSSPHNTELRRANPPACWTRRKLEACSRAANATWAEGLLSVPTIKKTSTLIHTCIFHKPIINPISPFQMGTKLDFLDQPASVRAARARCSLT